MALEKTKEIITGFPVSGTIQWAAVSTTVMTTLIAYQETLATLFGTDIAKGVVMLAALISGGVTAYFRTTTTVSLDELKRHDV